MFHIIAMANEIMVGRFHMITMSTNTWDISNIIMLVCNHKNKHYIAIYIKLYPIYVNPSLRC